MKQFYQAPEVEIVELLCDDIVTTSVNKDPDQGEWDAQALRWKPEEE